MKPGLVALPLSLALCLALGLPAPARATSAAPVVDARAPVFVVMSKQLYLGALQHLAPGARSRVDSLGNELVIVELRTHQLDDLNRYIHEEKRRCGGYFSFASRAEAEAYLRDDRSAQAVRHSLLAAYTVDNQATVNPWLSQVSETNLYNTINTLQTYQNRYYTSSTGKTSAESIRTNWQNLAGSRTDVTSELFTACSDCSTQPSVILTVQGAELPNEIVVMGAHLDSINGSGGGSTTQRAPGADDDASGIATLTETIRVALASGWKPKRTVKFMGYAAEEVGLRGSKAIANSFKAAGKNVVAVMQLDMTNYKSGAVEDMQLVTDYSNVDLKNFLVNLFDTYLAPQGYTRGTYTCGYGCSDHASWTAAGYPAGMMFEAGTTNDGYNPYIHTANDTLANMGNSAANSVKFAKLGLAFLGEAAKTAGTAGNTPPVANFSSSVNGLTVAFTDTSTDANGTIASRSWNFGDGTTSTAANPSKTYSAAGTYTVTLTVTDNQGATNTKSASVTVGSSSNVLSNGVPVNNLSGAAGAQLRYTLNMPSDSLGPKFVTSGGTGDADLYIKLGSPPTTSSYDCKSTGSTNAETCNLTTNMPGTYHVLVQGYSAFSGLSLTGSYSPATGGGQTYTNGTDYTISDNATVESPITVSGRSGSAGSTVPVVVNIVHTYIGDLKVDLVAPDGSIYTLSNRAGGSADNINKTYTVNLSTEALNGTWKLRVNDNGPGDVGKIDSWSITF